MPEYNNALAGVHKPTKAEQAAARQAAVYAAGQKHNAVIIAAQQAKAAQQQKHADAVAAQKAATLAKKNAAKQKEDAKKAAIILNQQQKAILKYQKSHPQSPITPPAIVAPSTSGDSTQSNLIPGGANGDVSGTGGATSGVLDPGSTLITDAVPNATATKSFWGGLNTTDKVLIVSGGLVLLVVVLVAAQVKAVVSPYHKFVKALGG